jgi:hypothetical protein
MQANIKRYQCRHIFTAGNRCGSPSLRNEHFCYYHHTTRKPAPKNRPLAPFEFELPIPEDRAAIQQALGEVLRRIATNQIDPRRAGLLLYGLQIAACVLPKPERPTKNEPRKPQPQPVEEIIVHPELGILAPETEFSHRDAARGKSLAGELLKALRQRQGTCPPQISEAEALYNEQTKPQPGDQDHVEDEDDDDENEDTIPTLQACADSAPASSPDLNHINRILYWKTRPGACHRTKDVRHLRLTASSLRPKTRLTTSPSMAKMQKIHSPIQ